jgi:hypothetical protein
MKTSTNRYKHSEDNSLYFVIDTKSNKNILTTTEGFVCHLIVMLLNTHDYYLNLKCKDIK